MKKCCALRACLRLATEMTENTHTHTKQEKKRLLWHHKHIYSLVKKTTWTLTLLAHTARGWIFVQLGSVENVMITSFSNKSEIKLSSETDRCPKAARKEARSLCHNPMAPTLFNFIFCISSVSLLCVMNRQVRSQRCHPCFIQTIVWKQSREDRRISPVTLWSSFLKICRKYTLNSS